MGRYSLLDESWIKVIKNGEQTKVSLLELFTNTGSYRCLAGEMKAQDFAILRFLLAIVQTVFSRYDSKGNPYPYFRLNDMMQQDRPVDEDDLEDYQEDLTKSWEEIWKAGRFPDIVISYLEKWRDHFFLYDDKYPFYQLTKEEMDEITPEGKKPTKFAGKNLNRLISESDNKVALFSPVVAVDKKDLLCSGDLARWLIMLQGYIGVSDKTSYIGKGQKPSKGWMFDIGGLYLEGDNLFETLMFNYIPVHPDSSFIAGIERPCWENAGLINAKRLRAGKNINNLAELYTNWCRAIYIKPDHTDSEGTCLEIIKLPAIEHRDNFLEPMTVWNKNKTGENKGHYTPRKHRSGQAVWRSFGLIALRDCDKADYHQPAIMWYLNRIRDVVGNKWITINAVSMKDDGNATSWVPTDEILSKITANDLVIADTSDNGWITRINDSVEITKTVAGYYRNFILDIAKIRGMNSKNNTDPGPVFADNETEKLYQELNEPFQNWLAGIEPDASMNEKVEEWYQTLERIVLVRAEAFVERATTRDLIGIKGDDKKNGINIVVAYKMFKAKVEKKLKG